MRSCAQRRTLFQCHRKITEESEIPIAQHGINCTFGPSLGVSRVSNDDHFVVLFLGRDTGLREVNASRQVQAEMKKSKREAPDFTQSEKGKQDAKSWEV